MKRAGPPPPLALLGVMEHDLLGADPAHASRAHDLEFDPEGYWRTMPGTVQVGSWTSGTGALVSVYWFELAPGHRYLVYEQVAGAGTVTIGYVLFPAGTPTAITTRRRLAAMAPPSQFIQSGQWLYHTNGLEHPIRLPEPSTGALPVPMGFSALPPAPRVTGQTESAVAGGVADHAGGIDIAGASVGAITFASPTYQRGVGELPAAGGVNAPWLYGYAWSDVNDLGQVSPPSPIVWAHGQNTPPTAGLQQGKWMVRLKVNRRPEHVVGGILWRTINVYGLEGVARAAPTLYLLRRFSYAGEFDWMDHAPDAELVGFDQSELGLVPLGLKALSFWQGSCFGAAGSRAHWSAPGKPEQFPPDNYADVGTSATGDVVATFPIPSGVVYFKRSATFILKGNHVTGFRLEVLSTNVGCAAARTIALVPGVGLVWLSADGPMLMRGTLEDAEPTRIEPIRGIRKSWRRYVSSNAIDTAWVVVRPEVEEVWWHLPIGKVTPTWGFVWHYGRADGWTTRPSSYANAGCATRYAGHTFVGSSDDSTNGRTGIHVVTRGSTTAMGVAGDISGSYATGPFRTNERTNVQRLELWTIATGDVDTIEASIRPENRDAYVVATATNKPNRHPDEDRPRWGVSSWGTTSAFTWTAYEPAVVVVSIAKDVGMAHEYRFRGTALRLIGLSVQYDPDGGAHHPPPREHGGR